MHNDDRMIVELPDDGGAFSLSVVFDCQCTLLLKRCGYYHAYGGEWSYNCTASRQHPKPS